MTQISVKAKLRDGIYGIDDEPICEFIIYNEPIVIHLCYDNVYISSDDYMKLIKAIKNNKDYILNYLDSNGYNAIHHNSVTNMIEFYLSKWGAGSDGSMTMTIPNSLCVDAITTIYNEIHSFELVREEINRHKPEIIIEKSQIFSKYSH